MTFTVTSANTNANPNTRVYTRFSDAALDVVEARILQGIHTRTADRDGRKVGQSVARWVFKLRSGRSRATTTTTKTND